jgi:hypothetical protein
MPDGTTPATELATPSEAINSNALALVRNAMPLTAKLREALDAIEHVDALVSTASRSIASGDACDGALIIVLDNHAWPKIEETRQAIETALRLAGEPQGLSHE